jgi:hypothetical protein
MIVPIVRRDKQGISIMAAAMRTEVLEHSGRSRYQPDGANDLQIE